MASPKQLQEFPAIHVATDALGAQVEAHQTTELAVSAPITRQVPLGVLDSKCYPLTCKRRSSIRSASHR